MWGLLRGGSLDHRVKLDVASVRRMWRHSASAAVRTYGRHKRRASPLAGPALSYTIIAGARGRGHASYRSSSKTHVHLLTNVYANGGKDKAVDEKTR